MDLVFGREIAQERRPMRHLDPVLLTAALGLAVIGLLMIYSATNDSLRALDFDPGTYLKRQLAWLAIGSVLLLLSATFDYRFVKVYAGLAYAGTIAMLLLVRTPLGTTVAGSQRWFELFGFQLTPSELMKLSLIAMLGAHLSELRVAELSMRDVIRIAAIAVFPIALVFFQPDVGTAIVLTAVLVGILIVAGTKARYLAVLALTAFVLVFGAFHLGIIKEYQVARLTSFLDPENDPTAAGYNRLQAEIAIGAGGLVGLGYLNGTQTGLDFVPEQHTDFIFTVVGEEFGFIGAMVLLTMFCLLLWRAFRIAALSKDLFGTFLAAGIASMFAVQIFINVGMTLGIMPITGIPLPFVSYGGSSMMTNFVAVGLLLNVHMRRFK